MKAGKVRPLAICVFRDGDRILVAEGYDAVKSQVFYRPLGGKIEFGELGRDTIRRELKEELLAEVTQVSYLGTLENLFTFNGQKGHEIVLVYDGRFTDQTLYERPFIPGLEQDGEEIRAVWKSLAYFKEKDAHPLYPDGLLGLLRQTG